MNKLKLFLSKWIAFFFPAEGWKERLLSFRGGANGWPIPGKPEKPPIMIFPLEWVPHRLQLTDEDDEVSHTRGFILLSGTCVESGEHYEVGQVLSCLRCGVYLSEGAADSRTVFDPPCCRRCRAIVAFA